MTFLARLTSYFRAGEKEWARKLNREQFEADRFTSVIGYRPRNWRLFFQSLTHRSYLQYTEDYWTSNERLEFLGDAVLSFVVADFLFRANVGMEEGDLTKVRSRLVNRRVLAQCARNLGLSDFLFLSTSAAQSLDSGSDSILADAFEALVGAIYLDGGMKQTKEFIYRTMLEHEGVMLYSRTDDNYKSALLEYAQGKALGVPKYNVIREEGPEHERLFTVEVLLGTESYGVGAGRSKKDAEQAAALQALGKISKGSAQMDARRQQEQ